LNLEPLKRLSRVNFLPQEIRERIPNVIVCTTITLLVSLRVFLTPGYVSAGDLVPPYDIAHYFAFVTSPWNYAYSFGNIGANSGALFSLQLYVSHFIFGLDTYLSDKIWIFFFYWLSGIVFSEVATQIFSKDSGGRVGLARLVAIAAYMLSPITITNIVVPTLIVSTSPVLLSLIELRRIFLGNGTWSYLKFSISIALSAFYFPSVFFAIIFSTLLAVYMLVRTRRVSLWVRRTTALLALSVPLNLYWLLPLWLSFFGQGSLYGTSQIPQFNSNELYTNWSAQYGWTALQVVSLTRTVFTPFQGYSPANPAVVVSSLVIVMLAGLALVKSAPCHKRMVELLAIVLISILYLGIRDSPVIESLAFLLSLMWNSGIPLRGELWNLFKQPAIMLSYLPQTYALLAGIAVFGLFSKESKGPFKRTLESNGVKTPPAGGGVHSFLWPRIRFGGRILKPTMLLLLALIPLGVTGFNYSLELSKAFNSTPIPTEFVRLNSYFDSNPTPGRLLFLPPRSYGGFFYSWWPKDGYPVVTWPLYAATPPAALLDASTPDSANLLIYLYLQGIVRKQTYSVGPMLSTMGGTYVAYSSDYVTPGLNVPTGSIEEALSLQHGLSPVYTDGSLSLFRVKGQSPPLYAATSLGLVVGSISTMFDLYAHGYDATRAPIVMAYQLDKSSLTSILGDSDYVILGENESVDSLVLLMNSDSFLLPTSVRQAPTWNNVAEGSLMWVFNGLADNVTGNLLYGKSASVSRTPGSVLSVRTNTQDSDYTIWTRIAKGPEAGYLSVRLDGTKISTIDTNQTNWSFDWVQLPLTHLAKGQHTIEMTNGSGLNAVNAIALLSRSQYRASRQMLVDTLSGKHLYAVSNGSLSFIDLGTNSSQVIGQFDIPTSAATLTYAMNGQGHYTATVESTKKTFLVLTEYFDSTFDATPSAMHFPAQYVMNGYVLEPNGKQTVGLQYRPASVVESSKEISLGAGIVSMVGAMIITFRDKRQKPMKAWKDDT
jgi:hypothetical protein